MLRTVEIPRQKSKIELRSLLEKITYISMLSMFIGMVSYLAINCTHTV